MKKPVKALPKKPLTKAAKKPAKKEPVRVNLGCGINILKGFINVDKFITEEELKEGVRTREGVWKNAIFPEGAEFLQADMVDLPFEDNSVDYVECLEALEHVQYKDVEKAVMEMYRILKPGGELALSVPDMDDMTHVWQEQIATRDWDPYAFFGLVQQFYGNQIHKGEFHTAAFNENYLRGMLNAIGFDEDKIEIDARKHNEKVPTFKGARWDPDMVLIIGMLTVKAIK